ncbi:MAG: hypothetical protein AABZ06_09015 [Bdellovibrionota bacterium]
MTIDFFSMKACARARALFYILSCFVIAESGCGKPMRYEERPSGQAKSSEPSKDSVKSQEDSKKNASAEADERVAPTPVPVPVPVSEAPKSEHITVVEKPFQPVIMQAGSDSSFPDGSVSVDGQAAELISNGSEMEFKNVIPLSNENKSPRVLFLVWNEDVFLAPIREAHFLHRVMDPLNRLTGVMDREPASFDAASGRWFIPFVRLFGGQEMNANPSDEHSVTLDFLLADGSKKIFYIRFRAVGFIPDAALSAGVRSSEFTHAVPGYSNTMFLGREEIHNPSSRHLRLLLRFTGDASLNMRTVIGASKFAERPSEPPAGPFIEKYYSSTGLVVSYVKILRATGERLAPISGRQWISLILTPKETVGLEWIAKPASVCALPPPATRSLQWITTTPVRCHGFKDNRECTGGDFVIHRRDVTETWSILGMSAGGRWGREVRLAERFLPLNEVSADIVPKSFAPWVTNRAESLDVAAKRGEDAVDSNAAWSCQGAF